MIIEVKVPALTSVEIAMLNEHLNKIVYKHTGIMGESKISEPTIKSDNSKVIATLQAKLEKAKELIGDALANHEQYGNLSVDIVSRLTAFTEAK